MCTSSAHFVTFSSVSTVPRVAWGKQLTVWIIAKVLEKLIFNDGFELLSPSKYYKSKWREDRKLITPLLFSFLPKHTEVWMFVNHAEKQQTFYTQL